MKIVMAILRFKPAIGGGEEHVYQISKRLIMRGHEVIVYTSDLATHYPKPTYLKGKEFEEGDYNGVPVKRFHAICLVKEYPVLNGYFRALLREKPDIIHAHGFGYFPCDVASLICRIRDIPFILTTHGFFPASTPSNRLLTTLYLRFAKSCLLRWAKRIICVSSTDRGYYSRLTDPSKIVIIPNGIDIDYWRILPRKGLFRDKYGIRGPIIGSIGRIVWAKGFQYLIKATPMILKEFPNAKIVIVGQDFGYLTELKELAYRLRVHGSVIFTGPLRAEEVKEFYIDSDVVVIPSIYETFGIVALEAMACGKPIVASHIGGLREILKDGVNGFLVKPGNSDELARSIIALLKKDDLREKIGSLNRAEVIKYSWDRIVDQIEEVYYEVLAHG
jgi:glycosyltransferase involved in cell wall biosynthesis